MPCCHTMPCRAVPRHARRFNGNNGFVARVASERTLQAKAERKQHELAQTFSHWTFEHTLKTGKACMVCDIQGVKYQYAA